jgi:hypothetical protein
MSFSVVRTCPKCGRSVLGVDGARSPVNLLLPAKPDKVELDPDRWILSDKTETKATVR